MPLINHSAEFLEKQKRRAIAKQAILDKENAEKQQDQKINLIIREALLREQLAALDLSYAEDRAEFLEIQANALVQGIPLIQFFSRYQYEIILKMIRAIRLHTEICQEVFDGKSQFHPEVFRETEAMIEMTKLNIQHLSDLESMGQIAYTEKYAPRIRGKSKSKFQSKIPIQTESPRAFENKVDSFIEDFFKSETKKDESEK